MMAFVRKPEIKFLPATPEQREILAQYIGLKVWIHSVDLKDSAEGPFAIFHLTHDEMIGFDIHGVLTNNLKFSWGRIERILFGEFLIYEGFPAT